MLQEARCFHRLRHYMQDVTGRIAQHLRQCGPPDDTDMSLAACLLRARDPHTDAPFNQEQLQAELFLEIVGQESVPWTVAWAL